MTSGNPILDKNLESIGKYNPVLKEKLLNLPCLTNDIQLIETELQEPNLSYNGLPLHSQQGAEAEAKKTFEATEDGAMIVHFVIGLGLGYLFKEFCEHSKGKIILYESDLEIIRVTLELVDFSKELSQANVKIASDLSELDEVFVASYEYKMGINFAVLSTCKSTDEDEAKKIIERIDLMHKTILGDYMLLKTGGAERIFSIFDNLSSTLNGTLLSGIENIYQGKTAIIVSAGPTLDQNIETIKKNRDKAVIFCVGTAFRTLAKHGITPDFINVLEAFDCSGQLKGLDLSNINMILEPSSNASFYAIQTKQKFIYPANVSKWGQYWSDLTNVDATQYISRGTVSYEALQSAKILGFKTIILVGQDLAFVNNSCYSKDSAYSDLVFQMNPQTGKPEYSIKDPDNYYSNSFASVDDSKSEQWRIEAAETKFKMLNESLHFVKGISGEMLPSDNGLAMFIEFFNDFALSNPNLTLINTSLIGAQIDGFENIPLEKALENAQSVDRIQLESTFKFDKKIIVERLKNDKKIMQEISNEVIKAQGYIYKYEKELKLRKIITQDAAKFCLQFLEIYKKLDSEYFQNNRIFHLISFDENIELQYIIKSNKETEKNKNIELLYVNLKDYYEKITPKISMILEKMEENIKLISEPCVSV